VVRCFFEKKRIEKLGVLILVKNITMIGLFAALTSIGAFIRIPVQPIPFTLQMLFVLLAGVLLAPKTALMSQIVYVAVGLMGAPIFAKGYGGIVYVLEPTFGYLIGFVICAFVTALIIRKIMKPTFIKYFFTTLIGLIIIFIPGLTYMFVLMNYVYRVNPVGLNLIYLQGLLINGFVIFLPSGILFCGIASIIALKVRKFTFDEKLN